MTVSQPLATVQVDMDPLYLSFPHIPRFAFDRQEESIYTHALPLYLDLFREYGVKATFFVVGRDLDAPMGRAGVERILEAGHEVANHTYTHQSFEQDDTAAKVRDVDRFEEVFTKYFPGVPLTGFKAPCYAIDKTLLRTLGHRYRYDSSMISVLLAPLLRGYYRIKGQCPHPNDWGRPAHFLSPRVPYRCDPERIWARGRGRLWILPVTTSPFLGLPMHFSFINIFGWAYFLANFRLLRATSPGYCNFAFHAVDLFSAPETCRRPGHSLPLPERLGNARRILGELVSHYCVLPSGELAEEAQRREVVA